MRIKEYQKRRHHDFQNECIYKINFTYLSRTYDLVSTISNYKTARLVAQRSAPTTV
jgi:hypothetical protein